MTGMLRHFVVSDQGQDLTEYALLLVFVILAGAAIFFYNGSSFVGIWSYSNSEVMTAASYAS